MIYPKRADDAERIQRINALRLVSEPDEVLDKLCELARNLLSVPIAIISVLDDKIQWLPNRCGLDVDHTPRDLAFCNYVIAESRPVIVPDAMEDERFCDNALVTGAPFIRFYAGMPLSLEDGTALATFCCIDTKPRDLSDGEHKILSNLAALAASQLRLRQANIALAWTSNHDTLTGLDNRRALNEHLETSLAEGAIPGRRSALLLIDMDGFKRVNDVGGHDVGDALLKMVSDRLRMCVLSPNVVAARMGGDEFAVLVRDLASRREAEALGWDLVSLLRTSIVAGGAHFGCRASIGISLYPEHGTDPISLLKAADLALYSAKGAGGDRFVVYTPELTIKMEKLSRMHNRARDALLKDEVIPFYQPKIDLNTGEIRGFEALLRLRGPKGLEPPAVIEAAFADPVLSVALGRAMLNGVMCDMSQWQNAGLPFGSVAVNITEHDIDADLAARLLLLLKSAGLPPSALQIEVTENVFLGRQADGVAQVLGDLRTAGIKVALDDFGTGFASLSHLRRFPVDWLKLDRSFVSDMDADRKAAAIVHGVIAIAQSLEVGVVAEGIETRDHLDMLRSRRCNQGQGYLFAKPMAASRVPHFLRTWQSHSENPDLHDKFQPKEKATRASLCYPQKAG